jgi:hypothetical protein
MTFWIIRFYFFVFVHSFINIYIYFHILYICTLQYKELLLQFLDIQTRIQAKFK